MTAVVLYSSILASAIMALPVWNSKQSHAVLLTLAPVCLGAPNATMAERGSRRGDARAGLRRWWETS